MKNKDVYILAGAIITLLIAMAVANEWPLPKIIGLTVAPFCLGFLAAKLKG